MNLLINEPPLQVLPSLAKQVGLNAAIVLQQLHFRSLISNNVRDGYKWVYKTYEEWRDEEFPFWSPDTIKRAIHKLENEGYVISTSAYNRMKMDKTKWYRIDYSKCYVTTGQNAPSNGAEYTNGEVQNIPSDEGIMHLAIPKEIKSIKNNNVEHELNIVSEIINYLNSKANKSFKPKTSSAKKFINGRLRDGYTLDDFKRVIDVKVAQWLNNPEMNAYLRPSTLFSATNFENYLNENTKGGLPSTTGKPNTTPLPKPFDLDFNKGEELE
ncbi:conserved phage C-terminal domain-containing protein [Psychrobacillus sp. FSL K6-1464]|uniref:conserved phage C-terminal domain-containing protein n=1 Tax=Psychrobacillus sp. FSL K6-1464 TaxID=2921545 RepID=UPI0030F95083